MTGRILTSSRILGCLCILMGCSSDPPQDSTPGSPEGTAFPTNGEQKTDLFGRSLAGPAAPYVPDESMQNEEDTLQSDMRARREMAWSVAKRVLDPVPLVGLERLDDDEPIQLEGEIPTVPRWQTWYGIDDFRRMFRKLYSSIGSERRAQRDGFSQGEIDAAIQWNAVAADRSERWPLERYIRHVNMLGICPDDLEPDACARSLQSNFSGATSGNSRIVYSPEAMTHLLKNYGGLDGCLERVVELGLGIDDPEDPENFAACLSSEFPTGSVLIKAHWMRSDFERSVPAYDTDAATLEKHLGEGGSAFWAEGERRADPSDEEILTIRLQNGDLYRLVGLHIMTKELRHWVWVTLWWSDQPNSDFGEDRPADFLDGLDPVWGNYKMAVVVDYTEKDTDPGRRYDEHPSLQAALRATGGPITWASNPYIEHGRGNARTNCIGCHQHGGARVAFDGDGNGTFDPFVPEQVIVDDVHFPSNGRTRQRNVFPADYLWSTQRVDNIQSVIQKEIRHFEFSDLSRPEARQQQIMNLKGVTAEGEVIFTNHCLSCHNDAVRQETDGPTLESSVPSITDEDLVMLLLVGVGEMPSWSQFSNQELANLRDYLRLQFDRAP